MRILSWAYKSTTRQAALLLAAAVIPAMLSREIQLIRSAAKASSSKEEIAFAQVKSIAGPVLWLDARSDEAFARGHVPGALLLDQAHWTECLSNVVAAWRPGMSIVVYCSRACNSSRSVATRLRGDLGVTEIFALEGGWEAWLEAQKG